MGAGMRNELESKFIANNGMLLARLQFSEFKPRYNASHKSNAHSVIKCKRSEWHRTHVPTPSNQFDQRIR